MSHRIRAREFLAAAPQFEYEDLIEVESIDEQRRLRCQDNLPSLRHRTDRARDQHDGLRTQAEFRFVHHQHTR